MKNYVPYGHIYREFLKQKRAEALGRYIGRITDILTGIVIGVLLGLGIYIVR